MIIEHKKRNFSGNWNPIYFFALTEATEGFLSVDPLGLQMKICLWITTILDEIVKLVLYIIFQLHYVAIAIAAVLKSQGF